MRWLISLSSLNVLILCLFVGVSVDDLVLVLRSWLVDDMWEDDPYVAPVPFQMEKYESKEKLNIG